MAKAQEAGTTLMYSDAIHRAARELDDGRLALVDDAGPQAPAAADQGSVPLGVDVERHLLHTRAVQLQEAAQAAGETLSYHDAVYRAQQEVDDGTRTLDASMAAPARVDLFDDLLKTEHRAELDIIARTLSVQRGVDYLDAIGHLQQSAAQLWAEDGPLTVSRVLEQAGTTRAQLDADARRLGITAEPNTIVLSAQADSDEETDGMGRVRLAADTDVAVLLHDDVERTRAYLAYRDTAFVDEHGIVGPGLGREQFDALWLQYAEAGIDLVATVRREQDRAAQEQRRTLEARRQNRREEEERRVNAKRRSGA